MKISQNFVAFSEYMYFMRNKRVFVRKIFFKIRISSCADYWIWVKLFINCRRFFFSSSFFFPRKFHHVLDKWYSPLWISEFMTFQGNSFTPSCNIDKKVQYKAGKSIFQHWTTFLRPLAWCKPGMMQASYKGNNNCT